MKFVQICIKKHDYFPSISYSFRKLEDISYNEKYDGIVFSL